ncbi:hypothetical protein MLD38_016464 [Melastoma candidum]|uniref:Uncharacterized protein n=1 Tax=Melastoma candidum TaxID=119954 RepID=A0ACB9QMJ6_9MYRT|nr:hypothetical protein MLD38_016464 [Melastoma candidum]
MEPTTTPGKWQCRLGIRHDSALVLQNCTITMDLNFPFNATMNKVYLGRSWKMYSRVEGNLYGAVHRQIDSSGGVDAFGLRMCCYADVLDNLIKNPLLHEKNHGLSQSLP